MEFRILGPVGMWSEGTELPLKGSKQRTILAALLLGQERVLSDTQLGEVLWGKNPPATYQAQIYTYASRLRKHLQGNISIIRQGPGYLMRIGSARFDFHEFERSARSGRAALRARQYEKAAKLLRAALDLWRGPTLTDVTELLAQTERPRIDEAHMETLESWIDAELALGRHDRLTSELIGLVSGHPLRERIRAQFMMALYRCDRQADAIATYHEGCRILEEELGVDPGPTLKNAYQAILTNDLRRTHPTLAGAGHDTIITVARPAVLATDIPDFSGRSGELELASELMRPEPSATPRQPPAVVVTGMAGIGKTAFALRIANLCRSDFPDGELSVDLRGSGDAPLTPYDALGALLGGLGFNESSLPTSVDRRAHLYRSTLARRSMIVILDDAAGDSQVRPLLAGNPRCRTLVTTCPNLTTLEGQYTIILDPLGFDEAFTLFTRIIGSARVDAEPESARRIVEFCGGLPLAVRIAGARIVAKRHWQLSRFAARLAHDRCRLDELRLGDLDVRERLARSYRMLNEQSRRALLRLALVDVDSFPHSVTSAVLGLSDAAGEQITENLLDLHLLELAGVDDTGRYTYRFHDVARLVARELAHDEALTHSGSQTRPGNGTVLEQLQRAFSIPS